MARAPERTEERRREEEDEGERKGKSELPKPLSPLYNHSTVTMVKSWLRHSNHGEIVDMPRYPHNRVYRETVNS